MHKYTIRKMHPDEVVIALDWARKEGWNPGLNDANCFYQADPNGFYIGLVDGKPAATCAAIVYDDHYAFGGLYIVQPEFRKRGYGTQLANTTLSHAGDRIIGLDGVIDMAPKYETRGFVATHKSIRFQFDSGIAQTVRTDVISLLALPFDEIKQFDRQFFPAERPAFLKYWISQPDAYALAFMENGHISGYGVIRKCHQGYKIGPLFAKTPNAADVLFQSLCSSIHEGPVFLDIPEPNKEAAALASQYKMKPVFEVLRMYKNGKPDVNLNGIYGITSFELG